MWAALGAGMVGWLLLLSGAGKLTLWAGFREGLTQGLPLPGPVTSLIGWIAPPVEVVFGLAVLGWPHAGAMLPAAALFALFSVYQGLLARQGKQADCKCYGRLRKVRSGRPAMFGNGGLALVAVASLAAGPQHWVFWRIAGGAALAAIYLAAMGAANEPKSRFVFAEVRYLEERAHGKNDRQARATVAEEFGLSFESSFLLLPRSRAAVILMRRRLGLKTTL